jgi:hypothetical protein
MLPQPLFEPQQISHLTGEGGPMDPTQSGEPGALLVPEEGV